MSTRRAISFSACCRSAAALALALVAPAVLRAQQAPAASAAAAPSHEATPLELAQAQLAQAQAQMAQSQAQLERAQAQLAQALAMAQQAQTGQTEASLEVRAAPATQPPPPALARLIGQPGPQAGVAQPEPSTIKAAETSQAAKPKPAEPFAFADFTWMNGNPRTKDLPMDTKFFTPEVRVDVAYIYDFNHPKDDTIVGSAEVFRAQEFQLTQLGVGGDFHYDNVRGRLMTQFGMYSQTQPRNDASPGRGQWGLDGAYRYLAEAYGGYHFDVNHGINVDAGIFLSYIGLFSWYNFDNWAYQPSYVSSNTPFFFNGVRVQWFPTEKLKIEPWFINGWQSYGRFNDRPGLGFEILYRPNGSVSFVANGYGVGADTLGVPGRIRYHSDNSLLVKYFDRPEGFLDKMAFSLTVDAGCEAGGGVHCSKSSPGTPAQYFLGYMFYNRFWFANDHFAVTLGGGQINNPGRYLVLLPPINGATAFSGTPYFSESPGDQFRAYDGSITFDWMPSQYITFRTELNRRGANVPYFAGPGGVTPLNGNTGAPGSLVSGFTPDLRKTQTTINSALLVKF